MTAAEILATGAVAVVVLLLDHRLRRAPVCRKVESSDAKEVFTVIFAAASPVLAAGIIGLMATVLTTPPEPVPQDDLSHRVLELEAKIESEVAAAELERGHHAREREHVDQGLAAAVAELHRRVCRDRRHECTELPTIIRILDAKARSE